MRFYKEEEIVTALKIAKTEGPFEAAKAVGCAPTTVVGWAKKALITIPRKERIRLDWMRIGNLAR